MDIIKKLLKRFDGLQYPQEYLCLANESFQNTLLAYLLEDNKPVKDVTFIHAFIGYCPLVFVLSSTATKASEKITIVFTYRSVIINEVLPQKAALAILELKKIKTIASKDGDLVFYKGDHGEHRFTSSFSQAVGQIYNRLYNQKPGNVFLKGNLYKQVQIAYALPRKICLVTVEENGLHNLFPTDLHGQVSGCYIISLRHGGFACQQVQSAKKIALSDMNAAAFKTVYSLGKNHMQALKERSAFPFSENVSNQFNLPLPKDAIAYKELQLEDSFDAGIHRILVFKIISTSQSSDHPQTLTHIHNVYATWRRKKGLQSNYLYR